LGFKADKLPINNILPHKNQCDTIFFGDSAFSMVSLITILFSEFTKENSSILWILFGVFRAYKIQ
jgi:hypothetical protein